MNYNTTRICFIICCTGRICQNRKEANGIQKIRVNITICCQKSVCVKDQHNRHLTIFSNIPTAKFPMISDFRNSHVTARTKAIVEDYLKIDYDVLEQTQMAAFLLSKVDDPDGVNRVETVVQLLQKLQADITDTRAFLMKQITDALTGK